MSTTIRIPMNEETRIALEDSFVDTPNMDARKHIFGNIKNACQDAKRSIRNKVTPTNQKQEDGTPQQQEASLKGVNLEDFTLTSDENWLPKNMDAEDNKPIELKLGDNTMGYIKNYGQITGFRHKMFNEAEERWIVKEEAKLIASKIPEENLKRWREAQEKIRKKRLGEVPQCIEECLYVSIWPLIQQKLDQNDGLIFDKEYDEMYPKEEPVTKPTR